jgi:hypothetical protein
VSLKWDAGDDLELQVGGSMTYSHIFLYYLIIIVRKSAVNTLIRTKKGQFIKKEYQRGGRWARQVGHSSLTSIHCVKHS